MKAFGLMALALFCAQPAFAESAHNGRWKVDSQRIEFSDGTTPKSMSLNVDMTFSPTHLKYRSVNDTRPETPYISEFEAPLDGTPAPFPNQARFNKVSVKRLSPMEYRIMKMKDDDVISGEVWTFQSDGRSVVRRGVTKDPKGKSHAYDEWFTRVQ
jgi:hypothetical protein